MKIHNEDKKKALILAKRTKKNLEYFYKKKAEDEDVEEFTQLVNSMLGMIICLREDYVKGKEVTWKQVEGKGFKKVTIEDDPETEDQPKLEQVNNFSQLITKLRHSLAHGNFDFDNQGGKITALPQFV